MAGVIRGTAGVGALPRGGPMRGRRHIAFELTITENV